ncbi:MAG TPA: DUF1648 domain-containing protein [Gemmatimonadaceae bacterium]|nr:DUF1648 domain-containing protein [Gemmatimonadaceae bacterium]
MRRWLPAVLIAGAVMFSLAVFNRLPDQVPVHWGMSGEPNRYGSRFEAAFLMPVLMTGLLLIMQWYPSRDPRAANIEKFRGAYDTVVFATIALLAGIHVIALGSALGWRIDMVTAVLTGVGVLFIVLGNLLPRVRSNFIFGIRTPWTLSSEDVWTRSHRVGGYAMVAAGLMTIAGAFLGRGVGLGLALGSMVLGSVVPVVYSYVLWSRQRGGPSSGQP